MLGALADSKVSSSTDLLPFMLHLSSSELDWLTFEYIGLSGKSDSSAQSQGVSRQVYAWTAKISELQVILGMFSLVAHLQRLFTWVRLSAYVAAEDDGVWCRGREMIPSESTPAHA